MLVYTLSQLLVLAVFGFLGRIYLKGRGGLVVKLLGQAVHMEEIEVCCQ